MDIGVKERKKLYEKVRIEMGMDTVSTEITDKTLDILLDMAMEDYTKFLQDWIITEQWGELQNITVTSINEIRTALVTRDLDWVNEFTNAYSRQIEMGGSRSFPSKWTLEVDYFTTTAGTQTYEIPENREVTSVLWETPPHIEKSAFMGNFGTFQNGFGNYGASLGTSGLNGVRASAMLPIYSVLSMASDVNMREHTFMSPMTYRITQKGNKKLIWLYPIPNSRHEIRDVNETKHIDGKRVYYYYYDTSAGNSDECIDENYDHLAIYPSDIPIEKMKWSRLNDPAKITVRQLLTAKALKNIGKARGKFSGVLNMGDAQLEMDYRIFLEEGKDLETRIFDLLDQQMNERYSYLTIMEKRRDIAQALLEINKKIPPQNPIIMI